MNSRFTPRRLAIAAAVLTCLATSGVQASADLSVADAATPAGGRRGAMSFSVTRSADTGFAVTVDYATADGSAKAGTDYTATSGTLTFAVGETTKTVSVPVTAKIAPRPKTFTLGLSNAAAVPPAPIGFGGGGLIPGTKNIYKAVAGDFNGDGKPDIAFFDQNGTLQIDRNDTQTGAPGSTFSAAYALSDVAGGPDLAIADVNRDGKPDIVTGAVVLMNTTPTGSPTLSFSSFPLPAPGSDLAVGDFDKDGLVDIASFDTGAPIVHVLRNTTPKGATQPVLTKVADVPVANRPILGLYPTIAVGDFDGDGKLDLATSNFDGYGVFVHLNATPVGGPIAFGSEFAFGVADRPGMLVAGDLNGDGKADIVTANIGTSQTGVSFTTLTSKATAGSGVPDFQSLTFYGYAPQGISLADMDNDGVPDLVNAQGLRLSGQGGGAVTVWLDRTPKNAATPTFLTLITVNQNGIPFFTLPMDINGDGLRDAVSSDFYFGSSLATDFEKKVSTTPGTAVIVDGSGTGTITSRKGD